MNDKIVKAQKAINAYVSAGGNKTLAAETLGIARTTFLGWLNWAFELDLQEQKGFEEFADRLTDMELRYKAQIKTMQRMLDEAQAKSNAAAALLKIEDLEPRDFLLPSTAPELGEKTAFLQLGDIHYGEVIDMPGNQYDTNIATHRILRALAQFLQEIEGQQIETVHLVLGGDLFNGDLHEDASYTNEASVVELFPDLVSILKFVIDELSLSYKVVVLSVHGNHGRTTRRTWNKAHHAMNWDYLVARTLEAQTDAEFHIAENPDLLYEIYGRQMLITHGDKLSGVSSRNLVGGLIKNAQADILVVHHWHQPLYISKPAIIVGAAVVGPNEFTHYAMRAPLAEAGVNMWIMHEKKGIISFQTLDITEELPI